MPRMHLKKKKKRTYTPERLQHLLESTSVPAEGRLIWAPLDLPASHGGVAVAKSFGILSSIVVGTEMRSTRASYPQNIPPVE